MKKMVVAAVSAAAIPTAAVSVGAGAAQAQMIGTAGNWKNSTFEWPKYGMMPRVGPCANTNVKGDTRGNGVRAWQSILWASGRLNSASEVDGVWGPRTETATKSWQQGHGLTADACVGAGTWREAQRGSHHGQPHLTHLGGGFGRYAYRESHMWGQREVVFALEAVVNECLGWGFYPPTDPKNFYWINAARCR